MDGLASIPMDQVWATSSTGMGNPAHTTSGSSHSSRHPHPTPYQSYPQVHRTQSPAHSRHHSSYDSRNSRSTTTMQNIGSSSRPGGSVSAFQHAALQSTSSGSTQGRDQLFEPLEAATRDHRHLRHTPAAGHAVLIPSASSSSPSTSSSSNSSNTTTRSSSTAGSPSSAHSTDALQAATSLPASLHSRPGGSSSSSSGPRLLQRQSGSGSFLTATASQFLSSLGMLSGLSLLGSSPNSSSSSRGLPNGRSRPAGPFTSRSRLRSVLLVRSPALLLDIEAGDNYDDLLALDQFNVKRAVRPSVLADLRRRAPCEQDVQRGAQCFICFERWVPAAAAAAVAAAGPDDQASMGLQEKGGKMPAAGDGRCCSSRSCQRLRTPLTAAAAAVGVLNDADGGSRDQHDAGLIRQQQQQQQHDGLGCWDSWGAAMFGQQQQQQHQQQHNPSTIATAAAAAAGGGGTAAPAFATAPHPPPLCSCSSSCSSYVSASSEETQTCSVIIQQLPCQHEFCADCIGTWLAEHTTCPICRWTFPDAQTQLINLHK